MSATSLPAVSELLNFTGSVVVVTGASKGIGRGIAERFATAGAAVAVHYRSGKAEAEALAASCERAIAVGGDLCDPDAVAQLFGEVANELGPVDVLVNNAGIYPMHSILDAPVDEWQKVMDANVRTTHLCTQRAARSMKDRETGGAIVNVASIEGLRPAPLHSHYNAAKGGVLMYTQSAALELGAYGIRVNAVSPGLIWREGIERAWPDGVERFEERAPLKRLGRPEDIADACLFLASKGARWITGANLVVDGGVLTATAF
ncbi:MAG: SDR family NAD(P)-dependent oxidoreductase [Acidobacteriota bacterium]|nr:MAG: SDR family NAD(P)-dependent oxidoreductase [Acidobacteriota bacterium]